MSGYVDHAWRHRPKTEGGTDPIASSGGTYRNPVMTYALQGADWIHFDENGLYNSGFSSNFAFDATVPGESYLSNGPTGATDDYFVMGAPLGPQGSRWSIDVIYGKSTSGGRLVFEFQTQPIDPTITSVSYPNLIGKPDNAGTWYVANTSPAYQIDTYAAVPAIGWVTGGVLLHIDGADDTPLSANGSVTTTGPLDDVFNGNMRTMNGGGDGSLIWYMRVRVVSTVNASNVSGNKNIDIYSLRISRLNEAGGEPG